MTAWAHRAAEQADLPAIVALDAACFGNGWSLDVYRQELLRPFARLWVVEARGELVGLTCTWILGDEAHLLRIATRSDRRRRGLGRALLAQVLDDAAVTGCRHLLLEVAAGNAPALGLYAAFDFETIGRRERYYTRPPDDALVLRRTLGRSRFAAGES